MMTSSTIDVKGYKVYSKQTLLKPTDLDALQCPLCEDILHDPIQVTACGHRFCRSCIEKCMRHRYVHTICHVIIIVYVHPFFYSEGPYQCPVDNEEFVRAQVCYFCIHIFCDTLKFTLPLCSLIGTYRQGLSQRTSESGNRVYNTTYTMQLEGASNTASGNIIVLMFVTGTILLLEWVGNIVAHKLSKCIYMYV